MRVRVSYVVDVTDEMRRAINAHYGRPGLASRAEVKRWYENFGDSQDADALHDMPDDDTEEEVNDVR